MNNDRELLELALLREHAETERALAEMVKEVVRLTRENDRLLALDNDRLIALVKQQHAALKADPDLREGMVKDAIAAYEEFGK